MLLLILMVVFGIVALTKGEFKITAKKKVTGSVGRNLGIVLLVGALGAFVPNIGLYIQLGALILVIIIGLSSAVPIEDQPKQPDSQP
jgi:hypothetical protein